MKNIIQILLLSEVFLSKDLLDSALIKSSISYQVTMTGSMNDALQKIKANNFQFFVTDTYMIETISKNLIVQMIQLNTNIAFFLINYSLEENITLNWFELGFTDVVLPYNPLSLALSIKREIRNYQKYYHN